MRRPREAEKRIGAELIPILESVINVAPDRMRTLRPEVVDALVESIHRRGLINPITVRPRDGGGFWLIAGLHRLMAVKRLQEKTIPAVVLTGLKADEAELIEIDENLIRADLSPAEKAIHVGKRKGIYEQLHPETKHGAVGRGRGKSRQPGESNDRFTKDTSAKAGQSERATQRDATRAKNVTVLADIVGTVLDQGNEIDALAKLVPDEQRKLAARAKAGERVSAKARVKQVARAERERTLGAKQLALPDKKYGVIVTDDEWDDEVWSRETGMNRHASNHYPTSDLETIKARPVASIAARDCVLFMWSPNQHLDDAIDILRARGFDYASHYIWDKEQISTGFWNRSRHEVLLVGTRGNPPCPAPGEQWESVIRAAKGRHSAKPECFLEMIEQYYPSVPKIELNRRGPPRPGWDCWGLEAEHDEAPPPSATSEKLAAPDDDYPEMPEFLNRTRAPV